MSKITSPFNFVPLSDIVFYPQWSDLISHDIPFEDGEDGTIELSIKNISPLYVGAGTPDNLSSHIVSNGIRHYYIPGTTLKGCFRNVMEIMSYGKMEQYEDTSFGFRTFDTKVKNDYRILVRNVKCGWLWKDYDKCYLEECSNGIQRISHADLARLGFADSNLRYPEIVVGHKELSFMKNQNVVYVKAGRYKIVRTGQIGGKKHEYLFSAECNEKIEIPQRVIERFETVHSMTPVFAIKKDSKGCLREDYDNGKKIPVFFIEDKTGVICIGLTRNMKYPYKYSIKDLVKNNYDPKTWSDFENKRDLPQCIFGSAGKSSLKGRVQIGNAFTDTEVQDEELLHVSGVLGQPKPSYYPLYLKQDGKTVVNYSTTKSTIAGRKRYRITKDFQTIPLSQGNDNDNVKSHFNALPAGLEFTCRIVVHNLRKAEIGALLSSITFNQTEECYHNIGMAKAFGYGIIECRIKALHGLQHTVSEYIDSFDELMAYFLHKNGRSISSEESYRLLASIASPTHVAKDMKQMDFKECRAFTQEDNASVLVEEPKHINIDEGKAISNILRQDVADVRHRAEIMAADKHWKAAVELLNDLVTMLTKEYMYSSVIEIIREINEIINVYQDEENKMKALDEQRRLADIESAKAARREKGLAFLLETKVNSSELKISSLSQGTSRLKDFLKKNNGYMITAGDKVSVHEWLCSLERPVRKQDKKDFEDFNGASWKYIASLFEEAELWFGEINAGK